jgi:EmrB/QacA subfamily drug resistance transporter
MGLAAIDTTIVATAIPSIVRELGGFSLFTWVFSIYVLAQAVTIPVYGKLADLLGRKPVLIFGTLLFLVGSVLSGVSWSMVALIVFRGIQGLGAGAIQPLVTTVAGDLYSVEERARIQGWLSSVWGISAVLGPAVGGLFSEYLSWRWIFYINVPVGAAALFMIVTFLHEDVVHRRHRIDYAGAALLALSTGLFIFGLLQGGVHWAWNSAASIGVFAGAVVALVAFIIRERYAAEPMLPPWIVRHRILVGANLASAVLGLLSIGLTTFLPTYAQGVLGVGAVAAGFILAVMSITWPLAASLSGRLYLRIGFRDTALIGVVLALLAALFFVALPRLVAPWVPAVGSLIMGAGMGLMSTSLLVGVQSVVEWGRRGVVTGANLFARQLGQSVGAALYGSVANAALILWFSHAPASVAAALPRSVNAANTVLGDTGHALDPAVVAYVRQGLYVATHRVFVVMAVIAVVGIVVLLLTPRQFTRLMFAEEEAPAEQRAVTATAD